MIGVYALGKCQRLICLLRDLGFNKTIYLHGALIKISEYYVSEEIKLGAIKNASELKDFSGGDLILCPPSDFMIDGLKNSRIQLKDLSQDG